MCLVLYEFFYGLICYMIFLRIIISFYNFKFNLMCIVIVYWFSVCLLCIFLEFFIKKKIKYYNFSVNWNIMYSMLFIM